MSTDLSAPPQHDKRRVRPPRRFRPRFSGPITEAPAKRRTRVRELLHRRLLALADIAALMAALATIAVWGSPDFGASTLVALPLVVVVIGKLAGVYDRDDLVLRRSTLDEVPRLVETTGLFALVVWAVHDLLLGASMTGGHVLWLWGAGVAFDIVLRALARTLARRLAPEERCLVIGPASAIEQLRQKLADSQARAQVVAGVRLDRADHASAIHDRKKFAGVVHRTDADRVIVAPISTDAADTLDLIRIAKSLGVRVSVLPRVFEVVGSAVEFENVDGLTMLGVRHFGLSRSSRYLKRAFDLALGGAATLLALPLLLLIAAAIKLDSRGPVLFRQQRVGRDGRRFGIVKFRTMVQDAEALKDSLRERNEVDGGLFKIASDPRVTRVGRVLRSTSLDELPQLINVLRGEMSLVGPRPLVVDEDAKVEGLDRARLHLTPGMTGHWQVLGAARVPMQEMVGIDYLYVANWSLWQDVKTLLRTVPYMLRRAGM